MGKELDKDDILLGSGRIFAGKVEGTEKTVEELKKELTELGNIRSGCTLTYEPKTLEVRGGQHNRLLKTFITQENLTLNTGVCEWDINALGLLSPAEVEKEKGKITYKIGGKGAPSINTILFIHEKDDGGEIQVLIAQAQSVEGFEFEFLNEDSMTIGYDFKALADKNGTLVEISETFPNEIVE